MGIILLYIFSGNIIEKYQPIVGHETTVVILFSLVVTAIAIALGHGEIIDSLVFDDDSFFYFCLPPIVFNSGFNMRRKKFFSNLGYVSVFGFLGTIIAFVSFTLLSIGAFKWIEFTYYDPKTK
jgi:NhaP-type Na+/H+ or K+/H+ antiporter